MNIIFFFFMGRREAALLREIFEPWAFYSLYKYIIIVVIVRYYLLVIKTRTVLKNIIVSITYVYKN